MSQQPSNTVLLRTVHLEDLTGIVSPPTAATRKLLPTDIPAEPWRPVFEEMSIRDDGALMLGNCSLPWGFVSMETGQVLWVMLLPETLNQPGAAPKSLDDVVICGEVREPL